MIHVANLVTLQQPLVQEAALQDGVVAIASQADGRHMYRLSLSRTPTSLSGGSCQA